MNTTHIVITNCTARKRQWTGTLEMTPETEGCDLEETVRRWKTSVVDHSPKLEAGEMYVGRSISEAKHVATTLDSPLYVASAGLGLIAATDRVPPYNLTPSDPRGTLQTVLLKFNSTPRQWWDLLCDGRNIASLLEQHSEATLLIALPANYVSMLTNDLLRMPTADIKRVRLFTSQLGIKTLPDGLSIIAMPYDERLESIPRHAGTRSDYPQRALRHFVEVLSAHNLPIEQAKLKVQDTLSPYALPRPPQRRRLDDENIRALIREQWSEAGGKGESLLRHLRDVAMISCEQGRFRKLWRQVATEVSDQTERNP